MKVGTQEPIPYATPVCLPTRQSRYAIASLVISAISLLWLALEILNAPLPFDDLKQHRIGTVASVLALILSIAAYRKPNRKQTITHVAVTFAGIAFLAYFLLVPL